MACVCVFPLSCECLAKHVGLHILCRWAPYSLTTGPLRVEQRTQRKMVYNTVMRTAIVAGCGARAALAGHIAAHAATWPWGIGVICRGCSADTSAWAVYVCSIQHCFLVTLICMLRPFLCSSMKKQLWMASGCWTRGCAPAGLQ